MLPTKGMNGENDVKDLDVFTKVFSSESAPTCKSGFSSSLSNRKNVSSTEGLVSVAPTPEPPPPSTPFNMTQLLEILIN
jgi:hypothetical protein